MEITDVKVIPVDDEKLKAFVSIVFDQSFVVTDIKVINGPKGLFVSMPSKKRKNGTFRDIAHPLNNETRKKIEESIIAKYREVLEETGGAIPGELRHLEPLLGGDASEDYGNVRNERDTEDRSWSG